MILAPRGIEAAFGRALLAPLGNDAGGVRAMTKRDLEHLLACRHFEVQREVDFGHQPVDVAVGDVAPVFAKVSGNPVGAGLGRHDCRAHWIGILAAARIPDRRHMVDIDAEASFSRSKGIAQAAARLPGFTAGMAASSGGTSSAS